MFNNLKKYFHKPELEFNKPLTSNKMLKNQIIKAELTSTPFNIIQNSQILTKEDFAKIAPLTQELKENFKKSQVFRTRTEMEVSVLNDLKFPTASAKYWQSSREQNVMFHELVMLSYEYRKNIVEIKKLQRKHKVEKDDLEQELLQIEMEKKMFISKNQEKTAKDRIREIASWSEIKAREAEKMDNEELADVDNHQLISYTKRWIGQSIQMGDNGSPAERQNLLGQLRSGITTCIDKGILDKVINDFPEDVRDKIKKEYGLK